MTKDELEELFRKEIVERAEEIDKDHSEDWFSLSLGWAIAKGLTPDQAYEFTLYLKI